MFFDLARFGAVAALTYATLVMYRRSDWPEYVPYQETLVVAAAALALFAASGVVSRARREWLTVCVDPPKVKSIPCEKGCDWIDLNAFGTAKICECKNCRKCSYDAVNDRCVTGLRDLDAVLAEAELAKDETTRRAQALARDRGYADRDGE